VRELAAPDPRAVVGHEQLRGARHVVLGAAPPRRDARSSGVWISALSISTHDLGHAGVAVA
jgi:hypothetical protein